MDALSDKLNESRVCHIVAAMQKIGIPQTVEYAQTVGASEAHLMIFDRRPNKPWSKRIWRKKTQHAGWVVGLWGA